MPDLSAAPRAGHASRSLAASIAELVLAPSDPPSAVSGKLSGRKRLAWTEASDVATLRDAAHAASARINDVLLAVLAGVLHDLPGPRAEGTLHALVPVALGRRDHGLGNDYVSLFVPLPVDVASPFDRVRAARDAMREARAKDGVELGRHLVAGASFAGKHVEQLGVRLFSRKASVVATNLTGPPAPLHMGGRLITDVAFAAPVPGSIALSVNAFSYAGKLRVTIATDAAVVPDPRPIAALFEDRMREAIAALLHHAPAQT